MNSINLKGKVWMRLLFKKLQKRLTMYDMNKTSYKNNLRNNLIMWIVNQNLFSYFTYWLIIVHFTKSFVSLCLCLYCKFKIHSSCLSIYKFKKWNLFH